MPMAALIINKPQINTLLGNNTTQHLRAHLCKQLVVPVPLVVVPHHVTTWRQVVATADHQWDRVVVGRGGGTSRLPHYRPARRSRANKPEYLRTPNLEPPFGFLESSPAVRWMGARARFYLYSGCRTMLGKRLGITASGSPQIMEGQLFPALTGEVRAWMDFMKSGRSERVGWKLISRETRRRLFTDHWFLSMKFRDVWNFLTRQVT